MFIISALKDTYNLIRDSLAGEERLYGMHPCDKETTMHTKKLEEAVNGPINDVLNAMLEFGNGVDGLIEYIPEKRKEAARVIAGILTAAKVSIMQAGATINEMKLDDA